MNDTLIWFMLIAIPMLPLLGATVVGIWGTQMGGKKLPQGFCAWFTIICVALSFLLSAFVLYQVIANGFTFNQTLYQWMQIGSLKMEIGFLIDGLTAMMLCTVTFISLMVHIYTIGYMEGDEGFNRFFSYISLFTFSMLMLVMSNNLLQLFFGWEAVGLVSYLLIGFWYERKTAIFANMKAFLVNRIGDIGFILGIGLVYSVTNTLNYAEIFAQLNKFEGLTLAWPHWSLITVACLCLFVGAMGKSAQFPLHVWLPDSMEGPTPISALIHAATMVTAGIFMVSRMSPLFELSDTALNTIMIIGSITALFMGFLGIIQDDIKRVVAYSTLSQLGYMTVALGASAYSVALFHLMTHAFFKALLFLAAGSVIIGMHHQQNIRSMGGLSKYMKITWITSLIGSLALIGTPFFSGFYSKDLIIEAVHYSHLPASSLAYVAVLIGVFVTAFYSFRMFFLVFHGKENHAHHDEHAHHDAHHGSHTPHESPKVVTIPLMILAIPSMIIGFFTLKTFLGTDFFGKALHVNDALHPSIHHIREHLNLTERTGVEAAIALATHAIYTLPFWLALMGVVVAFVFYLKIPKLPEFFAKRLRLLILIGENKYFMDWFNEHIIAKLARLTGWGLWKVGDRGVIEGGIVNASWRLIAQGSKITKAIHTGSIANYSLLMIAGLLLLISFVVFSA